MLVLFCSRRTIVVVIVVLVASLLAVDLDDMFVVCWRRIRWRRYCCGVLLLR